MKIQINWSKVFMDFYPEDLVKQFKKVSLPFYLGFSLLLFFLLFNIKPLLFSKTVSLNDVFVFYFLFPVVFPLTLLGLLLSSIHILRHNNPFVLFHIHLKYLFLYLLNVGMIFFTFVFFLIYLFFMNSILHIL